MKRRSATSHVGRVTYSGLFFSDLLSDVMVVSNAAAADDDDDGDHDDVWRVLLIDSRCTKQHFIH